MSRAKSGCSTIAALSLSRDVEAFESRVLYAVPCDTHAIVQLVSSSFKGGYLLKSRDVEYRTERSEGGYAAKALDGE